jgi:hypothetical protein
LQCGITFCDHFREDGEEVRAAYLMVKSSIEEELTSVQQFMEALQFAGKKGGHVSGFFYLRVIHNWP